MKRFFTTMACLFALLTAGMNVIDSNPLEGVQWGVLALVWAILAIGYKQEKEGD